MNFETLEFMTGPDIKNEFPNIGNRFLDQLKKDIESIQSSKSVLVFANKSTNLCELSCENYENLLHKKTTKAYKKAPKNAKRNEDRKTKSFEKL